MAEIVMPAYACPDLVSAVIFAGARPVLVDMEVGRPWFDLDAMKAVLNPRTAAIIGVNLFGISERWFELRALAKHAGVVLIEDSAQYFPGENEGVSWQGDLVVLSFGRGKPVSLLGGGAVLSRNNMLCEYLPVPDDSPAGMRQRLTYNLKVRAYNGLLSPWVYWLPLSLPFLHLGETCYHPLGGIGAMDAVRRGLLPANLARYRADRQVKRSRQISQMLDAVDKTMNLPAKCAQEPSRHLLRYPVLCATGQRDRLYERLQRAGLGVSKMYPAALPQINGLAGFFNDSKFPNAQDFAARILTLATHPGVTEQGIRRMGEVFRSENGEG